MVLISRQLKCVILLCGLAIAGASGLNNDRKRLLPFRQLLNWSVDNVLDYPIDVAEYPGRGIGLKTLRDIQPGEMLLSIPRNKILTFSDISESIFDDPADADFASENVYANTWPELIVMLFSTFLLHESQAGMSSDWRLYLESLPLPNNKLILRNRIPNVPMLLNDQDQKQLYPYRKLFEETVRLQTLAEDYMSGLGFKEKVSKTEWFRTVALVLSRLHLVWSPDERFGDWIAEKALVPVADLLNAAPHGDDNVKCYTNRVSLAFDCKATKRIQENEEILVAYGPKLQSRSKLFATYGFSWLDDSSTCLSLSCNLRNIQAEIDHSLFVQSLTIKFLCPAPFSLCMHP